MIIKNDFSDATSASQWGVYNYGQADIIDGKLRYGQSSTLQGALLSPYSLTPNCTIEFDIKLVADYAGRQHGGCWLYDKDKKNWFRFYFLDNNIGTVIVVNSNPSYPSFVEQKDYPTTPTFNSGNTFKMQLVIADRQIDCYLDDKLIESRTLDFAPVGFALFAYGTAIDVDNWLLRIVTYTLSGNSKQDDGTPSRFVLIHDWETGRFIDKITPDAMGNWSKSRSNDAPVIVTHVGAEGYRPITDAPVIPVVDD